MIVLASEILGPLSSSFNLFNSNCGFVSLCGRCGIYFLRYKQDVLLYFLNLVI